MININIVTPVGNLDGLNETIKSIIEVSEKNLSINFVIYLAFNNNTEVIQFDTKFKNLIINVIDLNPISSRAKARNICLE